MESGACGEPGRFSRAHESDAYGCCVPTLTRFTSPHCPGPPRLTSDPTPVSSKRQSIRLAQMRILLWDMGQRSARSTPQGRSYFRFRAEEPGVAPGCSPSSGLLGGELVLKAKPSHQPLPLHQGGGCDGAVSQLPGLGSNASVTTPCESAISS